MEDQARQLAVIIQNIMVSFGTQSVDGACCENISHGEYRALMAVLHKDICTMQDIAKSAAVTKGGATRIVSRLEGKGLAHREQDEEDGRICCVTLTEEGRSLLKRIEDQLTDKVQAVLAAMDPTTQDILIISLKAFLQTAQQEMAGK